MKYLLDTNACVHFLNRHPVVVGNIQKISADDLAVSIVSIAELNFGAYNSTKTQNNIEKIEGFKNIIHTMGITLDVADQFGIIKTYLRARGITVDDFDILIGATAIVNKLTLITNNNKHFVNMPGIIITDWTKEQH
jgi:tRNA(fMet)-specific endonuclease VapC